MLQRVEDPEECIALLQEDGKFADLLFLHEQWDALNQAGVDEQQLVGDYIEKALVRLWKIAELFRNGNMPGKDPEALRRLVFKSYTLYQELEEAATRHRTISPVMFCHAPKRYQYLLLLLRHHGGN